MYGGPYSSHGQAVAHYTARGVVTGLARSIETLDAQTTG